MGQKERCFRAMPLLSDAGTKVEFGVTARVAQKAEKREEGLEDMWQKENKKRDERQFRQSITRATG